ncbi:MAG: helix-turn-helix transcriptional regulator [Patescibacteria group bacterium]|nr:helix-turn-helix transcriptional regulator [Patescibacteria group bacterium]MDD5164609.1 helix-turn-helix transcriptional regulator [Patescibacteria group bacterium]MDD5534549.1 helix-turn-helix transcriptional regulator [Patescibacteria group bacterium]
MNKIKKSQKAVDFQEYLAEQLKNRKFKKYYDEYGKQLEIAYQILQLRKQRGISQAELAKKIGTKQSNIARMETGQQNLTISMLQEVAKALNRDFKIVFIR